MRRILIGLLVILLVLLAACGGDDDDKDNGDNDDGGSNSGLGTVEISGAVSGPFSVDQARVDDLSAAMGIYTIVLADMEDDFSQNMAVLITVPAALAQAGTHEFGQPTSVSAPDVPFVTFVDSREGVTSYSGTTGSMTLDSVGETWSGRFEFTGTTPDGESVTASGTFSGLAVQVVDLGE